MINFKKEENVSHNHCSKIKFQHWTDLNNNNTILKLHDMCANKNCNCQKIITFTPRQYHAGRR